ncbi:UNKNOWN [Stylonychia lemnae]|uniref:Uncharacterized protein n=1 Tax=Stylonychia lemnae TaxID=5949 RepID=A0A078ALN7_STYLE|nr:UNKNOWN [Stylonychia lemnae]|eukprot:CDW82786.1 UNKNOWN [Stylonychia lemnae]
MTTQLISYYVKCYRFPIVFKDLVEQEDKTHSLPQNLVQDDEGFILHLIDNHKHLKYGSFDLTLAQKIGETIELVNGKEIYHWNSNAYEIKRQSIIDY